MTQADINQHLLQEIQSAQSVIARHDQEQKDEPYRHAYVVGVLTSTLAGMAGLGKHALHKSCFDPETTQAIARLIETIDQQ